MKNFSKISQEIYDTIKKSDHILLHLHPSPDGDSVGSSLAFYWYLKNIHKDVTVIKGDSEFPSYLKPLPGTKFISPQNYFELDLNKYDLFIILDTSAPNQISKIADIKFPPNLKTIVIDHHNSEKEFANINLVDTTSPATAQIIAQLFNKWKINITPEIAINLLIGIYMDTGGFKYAKTTSETFKIATKFAQLYPDFPKILFDIENSNEAGYLLYKGLALSSIEHYFSDKIALSVVSYQSLIDHHLGKKDSEKSEISNMLKSVIGWDIGICMVEYEPGNCSLSFRTRNSEKFDLSLIAKTVGVGGGHRVAAGSTIYMPFLQAKKHLIKTIHQLYPELGKP